MYCVNLNVCVAVKTDDMMHPFHVSAFNQKVRQFFFVNLFRGWWWCTQMSKISVWISSVFWIMPIGNCICLEALTGNVSTYWPHLYNLKWEL